jgi:DNA-binding XRE family transcriptional regulator
MSHLHPRKDIPLTHPTGGRNTTTHWVRGVTRPSLVWSRWVLTRLARTSKVFLALYLIDRSILGMRRISPTARTAVGILGESIRAGRLRRGWTVAALAERVGVSDTTMTKVERGDPSVSIGTMFEAATLVGVELYGDRRDVAAHLARAELALLPKRARQRRVVDNDF